MSFDNSNSARFSTLQLLGFVTFSILLVAVWGIGYNAKAQKERLNTLIESTRIENESLKEANRILLNDSEQAIRAQFGEKLLFHVVANSEKYPKLTSMLKRAEVRKLGIKVSAIDTANDHSLLVVYTMENNSDVPFCHSFLVQNSPFEVLDSVVGEQSRTLRYHDETLVFGAGKNGVDCWYTINDGRIKEFKIE